MRGIKFKSVQVNNRKKQLEVQYTSGKRLAVHYGNLGLKSNVKEAWVDKETAGRSIGLRLEDGTVDFMPYDQPLALAGDPKFLLESHLEILIAKIKEELKKKGVSKRYLAERLGTSDNQIQRLLNPRIVNKNLEQLYRITTLLGLHLTLHIDKKAA